MLTILERLIDDATGGYYILKQFDGFHDFSGKSRSSTITLAFLLQKTSLTLEEAIVKVIIIVIVVSINLSALTVVMTQNCHFLTKPLSGEDGSHNQPQPGFPHRPRPTGRESCLQTEFVNMQIQIQKYTTIQLHEYTNTQRHKYQPEFPHHPRPAR